MIGGQKHSYTITIDADKVFAAQSDPMMHTQMFQKQKNYEVALVRKDQSVLESGVQAQRFMPLPAPETGGMTQEKPVESSNLLIRDRKALPVLLSIYARTTNGLCK